MLKFVELDVKSFFHIGRTTDHVEEQPIRMLSGNNEAVGAGELFHRRVVRFRRSEPRRQFRHREIMVIIRAGRIVNIGQKIFQTGGVAQGQADGQPQFIGRHHLTGRFKRFPNGFKVPVQCFHAGGNIGGCRCNFYLL